MLNLLPQDVFLVIAQYTPIVTLLALRLVRSPVLK